MIIALGDTHLVKLFLVCRQVILSRSVDEDPMYRKSCPGMARPKCSRGNILQQAFSRPHQMFAYFLQLPLSMWAFQHGIGRTLTGPARWRGVIEARMVRTEGAYRHVGKLSYRHITCISSHRKSTFTNPHDEIADISWGLGHGKGANILISLPLS